MNLNEITSLDQLERGKEIKCPFGLILRSNLFPCVFLVFRKQSMVIHHVSAVCLDEGWVAVPYIGQDYGRENVLKGAFTPPFPTLGALVAYLEVFYGS